MGAPFLEEETRVREDRHETWPGSGSQARTQAQDSKSLVKLLLRLSPCFQLRTPRQMDRARAWEEKVEEESLVGEEPKGRGPHPYLFSSDTLIS